MKLHSRRDKIKVAYKYVCSCLRNLSLIWQCVNIYFFSPLSAKCLSFCQWLLIVWFVQPIVWRSAILPLWSELIWHVTITMIYFNDSDKVSNIESLRVSVLRLFVSTVTIGRYVTTCRYENLSFSGMAIKGLLITKIVMIQLYTTLRCITSFRYCERLNKE